MLPTRRILLAAGAAAAVALAGCSLGDDGPQTSEEREVGAFTRIANSDSVDVRLRVGEPQGIVVRAGQKVIDDVGTEVHDGTLHVTFDHRGFGGDDVTVEASVPRLTGIEVDGSGDVVADGVRAAKLHVASDGSGDVEVRGSAGRLIVGVDGSGEARLEDLAAREARVEVGGSGDAEVSAGELLDVAVDGSGDVSYHGDPDVRRSVDGSGEVSRAG
jgi:hypothetical protein